MEIPKIHFAFLFLLPIIAGIEQGAIQAEKQKQQLVVDTNQRVDCLPSRFPVANKKACDSVGCIWDPEWDQYHPTVPQCYFPAGCQGGYQPVLAADDQSASKVISLRWPINSPLQNPYSKPNLEIKVEPRAMGAALTVSIGNSKRFVPPIPLNHGARIKSSDDNEKLLFTQNTGVDGAFSFTVERKSDGLKIWDTSIGGFVFGDKFIQIATYLPTDRIYGFGENLHHQLKHDFSVYKTWGMFARDQPEDAVVPGSVNEYGVHPFYMGLESSGKAHGVFFLNSNAQEYTTGPAPHLIYRTIGGQLDLFFFPGPTPEEVIQQYQEVIGRPYLPAYWAFGYQLCRFGYKTLANLKAAVKRTQEAQIPLDVQYADIDYMEHFKDFTYDKENFDGFPQYADELHNMSMKLVLLFDPPVQVNYSAYQNALKMGASFVEWPIKDQVQNEVNDMYEETAGTKVMLGPMWPDYHTAFPDFFDPDNRTTKWWVDEYVRFRKELPFDGVWIDMNEPAVFGTNEERPGFYDDPNWKGKPHIQPLQCPHSDMDFPPYRTWNVFQYMKNEEDKISLCQNTLCMIGKVGRGAYLLYDTHSLYGLAEMIATREAQHAATGGKRGMIISRSTFPSAGHYGSHWLGDNNAKWPDLRLSIIGIQEFNMFGIPHVGADVCGFFLDTTEELCLRWQQLGAFYPYYRNHNMLNQKDQDPAQWPSVAKATREANLYRYRHLPYLYSLQFHATLHGGTVVRPMFFEFPLDPNTHSMSFQFMWGPAVVVVPVITGDVDTVRGYLPPHNEIWYSMSEAHEYGSQIAGGHSTFNAPRDTPLPTFLRGGYIIPRQEPDLTTTAARKRPFQLLVGLKSQGATSTAEGELYWDDGESAFDDIAAHPYYHFQFKAEANVDETKIHIKCTKRGNIGESLPSLDQIEVFGHLGTLNLASVKLNGKPVKMILSGDHSIAKREVVRIWCCQLGRAGLVDMNAVAASEGEWTTLSWENVPGGGKGNGAGNGRKWLATAGGWSLAIIMMLLPSAIRALMGVDVV